MMRSFLLSSLLLAASCSDGDSKGNRGGTPLPLAPTDGLAGTDETPNLAEDFTQIYWGRDVPQSDLETKFLPECLRKGVLFGQCFDEVHIEINETSAAVHIETGTQRSLFLSSSAPLPAMWAEHLVVYEPSGKGISSAHREDRGGGSDSLLVSGIRTTQVTDYNGEPWSLAGEYLRKATIRLYQPYQPEKKDYNWLQGTLTICGSVLSLPVARKAIVQTCKGQFRDGDWGNYSFDFEGRGEPLNQRLETISFEISEKHLRSLAGFEEDL